MSQIAVISSSVDAQFTARLVIDLRAAGWNVLDVAKTDLADAQRHLAQLQGAQTYVLILSQEALHSAWLNNEIERVLELARAEPDRRVVPLRLMPLEMPEPLATLEPVDFATVVYDAALARLQEALDGSNGSPAPEPALVGAGKRKAHASHPRGSTANGSSGSGATTDGDHSASASQVAAPIVPVLTSVPPTPPDATPTPPDLGSSASIVNERAPITEPPSPIEAAAPAVDESTEPGVSSIEPLVATEPLASNILAEPLVPAIPDEFAASDAAAGLSATQATASRFLRPDVAGSQRVSPDDDIMFTVYAPGEVERRAWMRLLVYASRETRDALAQVATDAEARLAGQRSALRPLGSQRPSLLRRGARLTLVPALPGFTFDPPAQIVKWDDGVQCHELRLRALTAPAAIAAHGNLRVFLGPLLLAEVPLAVMVREPGVPASPSAGYASGVARAYRRIYASFAPEDTDLARALASSAETLTDPYLRDALAARQSAPNNRSATVLTNAEVFQLFWSDHAARSPLVEREWRHALSISAPRSRIRGLYWSSRLRPVPAELRAVSFEPLDPARAGLGRVSSLTHALLGRR